jgi:adenosylhomocysteine nucleosidase
MSIMKLRARTPNTVIIDPVCCLRGARRGTGGAVVSSGERGQAVLVGSPSSAGHLAFICAMPMELRPLTKKLGLRKTEISGVSVRSGHLGDRKVVSIVTGMGTQLARQGTERLLDAVEVHEVVVVGITGAVEDETPIGTLVLPEAVVNSATGAEYRPAPTAEGAPHGKMWTTDGLTTDPDILAGLRAQGVVSLDMETAAIAETCEAHGIPWSVFRAISDRATDGSINEEVFHLSNQDGTPNKKAVARYFLKHPTHVARMAELAKGSKLAAETAADAAIRACSSG